MDSSNGYNYTSTYHSSGGKEGDFQKLSQTIGTSIQKISQNVQSIQRMVNQLGTPQDTSELRQQLQQIQHYTNQLAKDTSKHLREFHNLNCPPTSDARQWKLQKERLANEFSETLNMLQSSQRLAASKEKEEVKRFRQSSGMDDYFGASERNEKLIDLNSPSSSRSQTQMQMEDESDLQLLEEREQTIRQLESDIMDVNLIFKDLATMVHEQGEVMDSIEASVESASIHVGQAVQELGKASNYQSKARKKKCILFVIGIIVLAIIIGIIVWQTS